MTFEKWCKMMKWEVFEEFGQIWFRQGDTFSLTEAKEEYKKQKKFFARN